MNGRWNFVALILTITAQGMTCQRYRYCTQGEIHATGQNALACVQSNTWKNYGENIEHHEQVCFPKSSGEKCTIYEERVISPALYNSAYSSSSSSTSGLNGGELSPQDQQEVQKRVNQQISGIQQRVNQQVSGIQQHVSQEISSIQQKLAQETAAAQGAALNFRESIFQSLGFGFNNPYFYDYSKIDDQDTVSVKTESPTTTSSAIIELTSETSSPKPTTISPMSTTNESMTSSRPLSSTEESMTSSRPLSSTEESMTSSRPLSSTEESMTSSRPLSSTEESMTSSRPLSSTEESMTSSRPLSSTEESMTSSRPLLTTEESMTSSRPFLTTEESMTSSKPFLTTEESMTSSRPVLTTEESMTSSRPVLTTAESMTSSRPVLTTEESMTSSRPFLTTEESRTVIGPQSTTNEYRTNSNRPSTMQEPNTRPSGGNLPVEAVTESSERISTTAESPSRDSASSILGAEVTKTSAGTTAPKIEVVPTNSKISTNASEETVTKSSLDGDTQSTTETNAVKTVTMESTEESMSTSTNDPNDTMSMSTNEPKDMIGTSTEDTKSTRDQTRNSINPSKEPTGSSTTVSKETTSVSTAVSKEPTGASTAVSKQHTTASIQIFNESAESSFETPTETPLEADLKPTTTSQPVGEASQEPFGISTETTKPSAKNDTNGLEQGTSSPINPITDNKTNLQVSNEPSGSESFLQPKLVDSEAIKVNKSTTSRKSLTTTEEATMIYDPIDHNAKTAAHNDPNSASKVEGIWAIFGSVILIIIGSYHTD